jgi:hypothetical protein
VNAFFPSLRASLALAILALLCGRVSACPFCNAVTPTFAEERESATICALAEAETPQGEDWRFQVHRIHQGEAAWSAETPVVFRPQAKFQAGDLALLLGSPDPDEASAPWRWKAIPVTPASYLYFAKAPTMRMTAAERLPYFTDYLEVVDPTIAADAFAEIGRAPLEAVETIAHGALMTKLRTWVLDQHVLNERKGGYGLILGLAKEPGDRSENAQVLRTLIDAEREDFRAGFDGILAGYLLLEPKTALALVDERYLANPAGRPGDTRHALAALRFCVESARGPDKAETIKVVRHALNRPAFAADVVTDLARWRDWDALDQVAGLFSAAANADPLLQRAIIGYLKACPLATAKDELDRLRRESPDLVNKIERRLSLPIDR